MTPDIQRRICIAPAVSSKIKEDTVTLLLPNPRSGYPARYAIQDGLLLEIQKVDPEGTRSWFIHEAVQSDGSLFLMTPIDPVFMFIPILEIMRQQTSESQGRFITLDSLFDSDQYTSLRHLAHLNHVEKHLDLVCEVRDSGMKTYRLDDDKVMAWLKKKVEHLVAKFSTSTALVESVSYTESLPEECRQEAITLASLRLVCAYLNETWASKLSADYKFPELDKMENRTQAPLVTVAEFSKRTASMELDDDLVTAAPKEIKKPKLTPGQRKLANASKAGMKPISSFFAPKKTE
ncbi:Ribonuclease H2 subunit B [Actinomortierella ambigua]|uniref:Ribonuclease H2 subunit B n=1 Tax=Actinomortierella ambigua TaxID=1343610 RepID=A0A9P6QJ84_9FUNG|nr:Ribonuclease H2 subunit B [Actinomortierella ambigua]